jgi:preprotein translocase subunit SecE
MTQALYAHMKKKSLNKFSKIVNFLSRGMSISEIKRVEWLEMENQDMV